MKKQILIIALVSLSFACYGQYKDKYKDYKPCTECFDKWKQSKTGLENYGLTLPNQKNSYARQQGRRVVAVVVGIFVTAITYSIYNRVNTAANAIR